MEETALSPSQDYDDDDDGKDGRDSKDDDDDDDDDSSGSVDFLLPPLLSCTNIYLEEP